MKNIGKRIADLRKEKGFSQVQMSERLEIAQVNYSKIETGKTKLISDKLIRIANILEVDLVTLLWPDYKEIKEIQTLKDHYTRLKKLNELLIEQIKRDSADLEFIMQYHPETEPFISNLKYIKETRLLKIINEIKKLNT
jgi:transcriptional regulator with XRE-family HTH domain